MRPEELPDTSRSSTTTLDRVSRCTPERTRIVTRGNHPVKQGHTLDVYVEFGDDVARGRVEVIDDDDGDLIAIPAAESPLDASKVYRIDGDLSRMSSGDVYGVPSYDGESGVLTITREVKTSSQQKNAIIVEARTLGGKQTWAMRAESGV